MEAKLQGKRVDDVMNRLTVAMPTVRRACVLCKGGAGWGRMGSTLWAKKEGMGEFTMDFTSHNHHPHHNQPQPRDDGKDRGPSIPPSVLAARAAAGRGGGLVGMFFEGGWVGLGAWKSGLCIL